MENALYRWTGIIMAQCGGSFPAYMELFFFDDRVRTEMWYDTCMCDLAHDNDDLPSFEWYHNGDLRIGQFTYE